MKYFFFDLHILSRTRLNSLICASMLALAACQSSVHAPVTATRTSSNSTTATTNRSAMPQVNEPSPPPKQAAQIEAIPSASFERVASYLNNLQPSIKNAGTYASFRALFNPEKLMEGFGAVSPLEPSAACSKAIFASIAKLQRNHETMVLRHRGKDYDYFKDMYRWSFFEKNMVSLNAKPDISFTEYSRAVNARKADKVHNRSVAIVPNQTCTAAYVRVLNYEAATYSGPIASMSVALIVSNFLKDPDTGRVTNQIFGYDFLKSYGTIGDFRFKCDEDTCSKGK